MLSIDTFKQCIHGGSVHSWTECHQCLNEVVMQLTIARSYLRELAQAEFNDNGICSVPLGEPIRGRDFQSIARTGLGACSD